MLNFFAGPVHLLHMGPQLLLADGMMDVIRLSKDICCPCTIIMRWLNNLEDVDKYITKIFVKFISNEMGRACGTYGGRGRGMHKVLVGKSEGKRPLGRPRRRWEDNIKMALEEMGRGCGDWMELARDRDRWQGLVSTVMNFRVP